jgi:hypothetical protein
VKERRKEGRKEGRDGKSQSEKHEKKKHACN